MKKLIFLAIVCCYTMHVAAFSPAGEDSIEYRQREYIPQAGVTAAFPLEHASSVDMIMPGGYAETSVSLYTGTPNINIPLHTLHVGNYELPISLNYHSSGIKVSQEASRVGLGWNLQAGGLITRSIRDMDDLKYPLVHPDTALERTAAMNPDIPRDYDCEADIFFYRFGKYSGRFYINKEYGSQDFSTFSHFIIIDLSQNLRISYADGGFHIRTPENILYSFMEEEITQKWWATGLLGGKVKDICGTAQGSNAPQLSSLYSEIPASFSQDNEAVVAWHLSTITLPSGEEINFTYDPLYDSYLSPMFHSRKKVDILNTVYPSGFPPLVNPLPDSRVESTERIETENLHRLPVLRRIQCEAGRLEFVSDTQTRRDIRTYPLSSQADTQKPLKYIRAYNSRGTLVKSYLLKYDYFVGRDSSGGHDGVSDADRYLRNRLKLSQVSQFKYGDSLTYRMIYCETDSLPVKNTMFTDKWGYYAGRAGAECPYDTFVSAGTNYKYIDLREQNGKPSVTYNIHQPMLVEGQEKSLTDTPPFPNPDGSASTWLLTRLQTPLGGQYDYQYEPNTVPGESILVEERTICSNSVSVSENTTMSLANDGTGNFLRLNVTYRGVKRPLIPLQFDNFGLLVMNPEIYGNNGYVEPDWWTQEADRTMLSVSGGASLYVRGFTDKMEYHQEQLYEYYTFTRDIPVNPSSDIIISLSPLTNKNLTVEARLCKGHYETPEKNVGGMRLARLSSPSGTKVFDYTGNDGCSSGLCSRVPLFSQYKESVHGPGYRLSQYIEYASSPCRSMSNPLTGQHIGYSKVTTSMVEGSDSVVEAYYFHNGTEGVLNYSSGDSYNPLYGKMKRHDIFTAGRLLHRDDYIYDINGLKAHNTFNSMAQKKTRIESAFASVREHTAKEWGGSAPQPDSVWVKTTYEYNSKNYQPSSVLRQSPGESSVKVTFRYLTDKLAPSVNLSQLQQNNMPISCLSADSVYLNHNFVCLPLYTTHYHDNVPIKRTYYQYDGTPQALLSGTYTFLQREGEVLPISDAPSLESLPADTRNVYNSKGRLINKISRGGSSTVYLWGYYNQYVIAEIKNATLDEVEACGIDVEELASQKIPSLHYRTLISQLRTLLPNAHVTDWLYTPSIGAYIETRPDGAVTRYSYDGFNRLKEVREQEGSSYHVTRTHTYKYATE